TFYKENNAVTSIPGIDISVHQGDIDWQKVKEAGVEFAMIRVGYRTYGGGEVKFDDKFAENLKGAREADIETGVYFFSQATTVDEAIEEADAVLDAIAPYEITYPVVYDWEIIYDDSARTDDVPVDVLTDCCISFCERVRSAGYTPMIYQNKRTTLFKLDLPRLQDYDFWLAEYGDEPTYYYDFDMWQYSCTGKVPGITGDVDLNISFRDYSSE
ncbi:MAG: glycoside hydrolase family 25 protein, partial [Ruminococcus sp.]|nr:glycoside hydrolase family 25 protein [Ruminococcus sp.]